MTKAPFEDRLDDVRRAEYGAPMEVAARLAAVTVTALLVGVFGGNVLCLIWLTVHLVSQATFAGLLFRRFPVPDRLAFPIAIGLYAFMIVNYSIYPLYLIALNQNIALLTVASFALVGQVTYIQQRRLLEPHIVATDVISMALILVTLTAILLPYATQMSDRVLLLVTPVVLFGYVLSSLFSGLRQQRLLRDTQARYASSQKARALNQFVGGVAHDFNNQLTAILGHLELYELLDNPEEQRQALSESRAAARRAALTVQQLLTSSGRTRLSPAQVPMDAFLNHLKALLPDLLGPGMRVTVTAPPSTQTAWVDADMLETCMVQICLNAQDASVGTGRVRIWTETCTQLPPQEQPIGSEPPWTVLWIEDDGPGVSPEALPQLAEPFYTTKSTSEGAGLGLSAVAGFARQSGGQLMIRSAPETGLQVGIALPSNAPCPGVQKKQQERAKRASSPKPDMTTPRRSPKRSEVQVSGS
ncbi:hypothetical protein J4E08_01775 [Sagittula sp. NFXS13]|uniref:sensor histidine kinase n=1 Tax=Sagittula sp. NFXS13 TaxID=2819095 RepID=UPI0032DE2FD9